MEYYLQVVWIVDIGSLTDKSLEEDLDIDEKINVMLILSR